MEYIRPNLRTPYGQRSFVGADDAPAPPIMIAPTSAGITPEESSGACRGPAPVPRASTSPSTTGTDAFARERSFPGHYAKLKGRRAHLSKPATRGAFRGDIIYFHALFWPANIRQRCRTTPCTVTLAKNVQVARRGITAALPDIGCPWLRYYIAAKLNPHVEDIDFNPDDFIARVNSDLVGKYVNIASRASNFISRLFEGELVDVTRQPTWP
jgi:hypothetical protein